MKNKIYCGDVVSVLKQMPDNIIDLTVTNPPGDAASVLKDQLSSLVHNEKELDKLDTIHFDDDKIGHYYDVRACVRELYRITKENGVVVWVIGDFSDIQTTSLRPFRHAFYFQEAGFDLYCTIIYHDQARPDLIKKPRPIPSFHYMFVFSKGDVLTYTPVEGKDTNVWVQKQVDPDAKTYPGKFNYEIPIGHILAFTKEGALVLDPFCGSGTTLMAAKRLNRDYIGIDVRPVHCQISEERIKSVIPMKTE